MRLFFSKIPTREEVLAINRETRRAKAEQKVKGQTDIFSLAPRGKSSKHTGKLDPKIMEELQNIPTDLPF